MTPPAIEQKFRGIWCRVRQEPSLNAITPEKIREWAIEKGLEVVAVDECEVGAFKRLGCIVLSVEGGKACFPKVDPRKAESWQISINAAEREAAIWEKMEWFAPLWIERGKLTPLLKDAEHCTKSRAVEIFNYHTSTIYNLAFQSVCIEQLMPSAHSLKEFVPLAREAYLAFYSGYRASSIAALIPVIEGGLTRIVSSAGINLTTASKVDHAIDRAIETAARLHYEHMWAPEEYCSTEYLFVQDERVFVFETFRRWLHKSFFRNTGEYDGATWLNRHLFAHGANSDWIQSANFTRLIVALATLGVVESWHDDSNAVKLFFPEMDEDSILLWEQAKFNVEAQMVLKLMQEKKYHMRGKVVPEQPTDDGVLLRAALLSEECINDLVRPLRNAGWSVEVTEPDERALYMTVSAKSENEEFSVAFLYSCGTANTIYKELAKSSVAILYRGAPYKQDQFAYGVDVHVGPVTGWQPPLAPCRS